MDVITFTSGGHVIQQAGCVRGDGTLFKLLSTSHPDAVHGFVASVVKFTIKKAFFRCGASFFAGGHDSRSQMTVYKNINRGEARCPPTKINMEYK